MKMKINCTIFFGPCFHRRLYDSLFAASSLSRIFLHFYKNPRIILDILHKNPDPTQPWDLDLSSFIVIQASCGRILPSAVNVTARMGMFFPLASTACRAAYSSPPQHGTSMRVSVTLRTSFSVRIAVSFSA